MSYEDSPIESLFQEHLLSVFSMCRPLLKCEGSEVKIAIPKGLYTFQI